MEGLRESERLFVNKDLVDASVKISGKDTSASSNVKRKVETLFCVMRKRTCRHNSVDDDDMFPDLDNNVEIGDGDEDIRNCLRPESDFWFENLMDNPYDPLDEGSIVDDSGSDTDISESSEFDVISEHVLEDNDLITGSKSLAIWSSEDKGTLVSKWSLETRNSMLLLSTDENDVRSKEDEVLSSVSASTKELQHITDPQIFSGHSNDNFLFHSERKQDQMSCIPGLCGDISRCSVSKEDPEIPCNSDIFENDGDKSSAIEVRCGDVVNMQGSMEIMCINDELTLWNKDDEPIPISIVPPDGWESALLETCSLHQIDRCRNEYNVHDDNIGLEISPIPLTKTLERPSRPWSVCGSIAAVRNLPLMEDSSGACSSLDEQVYANANSSEDRDAELAQTPSTLYQEEVDGEDEIDIDAMIRKLNLVPDDLDSCFNREEWNMSKNPRHALIGLEHCTRTSLQRANMFHGAIAFAILHCRDSKHFVRKRKVILGRSSDGLNVDIDLGKYNYGSKISRRQALVKLENNESFSLKNLGKRHILVNGEKLDTGQIATLTSCSSIDIRGVTFVFKINKEAVRQFLENNTRRKTEEDTKFRWMKLGSQGLEVSAQGLGCMGLTGHYGASKPETDAIAVLHHAINSGVTFLDTSDMYGPETNEILLGKALKDGVREKVELATTFGISYAEGKREIKGDPAYVRAACEASLKRLDVSCIDHRIDTRVPIEITMGELKKLVEEGKIKYIGLSEASASTIRRAHAVHPITAVQLEWSLWIRDVEEEIVPTCRELGIGIVSYSPLGRGFFASGPKLVENLDNSDFRKALPRFQQENLDHNKILYEKVCAMSEKKGCTPGQLALAWVHHQGDDVCPIPGTTKIENLNQNIGALSVKLTPEEMSELETIAQPESVKGERYMATVPTFKNSDTPPLSSWNAV